jgi:uncharacterized protein
MNSLLIPTVLLIVSNVFMTFAWYGHLKHTDKPLWAAVLVSWGIAFFEYCCMIPANRLGYQNGLTAGQLKVLQELITLVVFIVFAWGYLGEKITWNYYVGFGLVAAGVAVVYLGR